jgi:hypothetical protein
MISARQDGASPPKKAQGALLGNRTNLALASARGSAGEPCGG